MCDEESVDEVSDQIKSQKFSEKKDRGFEFFDGKILHGLTRFAGTPTTVVPASTGWITTAPIPTLLRSLTTIWFIILAPDPINTDSPMITSPATLTPGMIEEKFPIWTSCPTVVLRLIST